MDEILHQIETMRIHCWLVGICRRIIIPGFLILGGAGLRPSTASHQQAFRPPLPISQSPKSRPRAAKELETHKGGHREAPGLREDVVGIASWSHSAPGGGGGRIRPNGAPKGLLFERRWLTCGGLIKRSVIHGMTIGENHEHDDSSH